MSQKILTVARKFIEKIVELEKETPTLPSQLIFLFSISRSCTALSYLKQQKEGLILLLSILIRPQQYFDTKLVSYIIFGVQVLYFFTIFFRIPFWKIISINGVLMRTNYLNFCLEVPHPPFCFVLQPFIIIFSAINQFINVEAMDEEIKNFEVVRIHYFQHVIFILQILISLCSFYEVNMYVIFAGILLHSFLSLLKSSETTQSAIHTYTLLLTFCEIIGVKNDASSFLVLFPLIHKIHSQFNNIQGKSVQFIQKEENSREKLIYLTSLIREKQYLRSLQQLYQFNSKNLIIDVKKECVKKRCIKMIMENIEGNASVQSILIDTFNRVTYSEEESNRMINELIKIMQEKLFLLQNINFKNYELYYQFLQKAQKLENRIERIYQNCSNKKNRILILFIYSEIQNNFQKARQLSQQSTPLQFEELDLQKLSYIISAYNQGLKILGVSKSNFFANTKTFQIDQCIPLGIKQVHIKLIEEFLQNGISKYMKNLESTFILKEDQKQMMSVDFGFVINVTDQLQFVTFISPSLEQTMALIMDSEQVITCISELFASITNISSNVQKYIGLKIKKLIPSYCEDQTYFENVDIVLVESDQETYFTASMNQYVRILENKPAFYILYFQSLRKQKFKYSSYTNISLYQSIFEPTSHDQFTKSDFEIKIQQQQSIAQEDDIDIPYEDFDNAQFDCLENKIECLQEVIKIESPNNKVQQRLRLLRRATFASKLRKQQSQNIEEVKSEIQSVNQSSPNKDFLSSFFNQQIAVVNKFFFTFLLSVFAAFIFYLTQTLKLNNDINKLVDDIDILDFGQLTFQPFESNLLNIFAVSEYQLYYLFGAINGSQYQQLILFPGSQVHTGYDELYNHFHTLFNSPLLQNILDENYLQIFQYTNTSNPENYNITLRKAFGILLEYQYETLLDFIINGKVSADNSNIYFLFKNYMPLKLSVTTLNDELLDQAMNLTNEDQRIIIILYVIGISIYCVPYFLCYLYLVGIVNQINRYYNILLQIPSHMIELQIYNLKYLLHQIEQDNHFVFRYQYNEKRYGSDNQNFKRTKSSNRLKYFGIKWKFGFFLLFFFILILASVSFYLTKEYFKGYGEVAKFYKSISDVSIDVASMYSAREVLYFRTSFSYLQNDTIQELLQIIDEGLNRTQTFLMNSDMINNTIMSDTFKEQYQQVMQGDLCMQLSADLQISTQLFCSQLFNGNMKNGLVAILTSIINNLRTEKSFSYFTQRVSISLYDLEGPFLISCIMSDLFDRMREDLLFQTNHLLQIINIIGINLLCLIGLLIILSKFLIFDKLQKQIETSKRFITFVPIQMLLFDDSIERYIKNLMYKNNQY